MLYFTFVASIEKQSFNCDVALFQQIQEQVQILIQELSLNEEDHKLRNLVCQLLQEIFEEVFTNCNIQAFGSSVNGLGWKKCDLDICLTTGGQVKVESFSCLQNEHFATSTKMEDIFSEVVTVLRSFAPGCTNIVPVMTAKCPVIRFMHKPSAFQCDLSINNRYFLYC